MNVKKINPIDFYEFVYDRQMMWYRREILKQEYPWDGGDPILRQYKFCNVYRELDRGSQYLIKTIIDSKKLSLEDKFLNCVAYRRFNLPGFFDWIGGPMSCKKFDTTKYLHLLDQRKKKGENLFSDAYIVSQCAYVKDQKISKSKHVQQILVLKDLSKNCVNAVDFIKKVNLFEVHQKLKQKIFGMGDFLAYQTVTDLTYFPEFRNKWDINSFVAMGPGSKPGVDLLFPDHENSYAECCRIQWKYQRQHFEFLKERRNKDWNSISYKKAYYNNDYLSLSNIQNCLCEFRKYVKLQLDPKARKRYYHVSS